MNSYDKMREAKNNGQSGRQTSAAPEDAAGVPFTRPSDGFATVADFMKDYRTSQFELSDGKKVEFRALTPADFQTFQGAALSARMTEAGLNYSEPDHRTEYVDNLSVAAQTELIVDAGRQVIVQACTSPEFTALPTVEGVSNKVPISKLTPTDILNLNEAIRQFSGVNEDEETFRGDSETDAEDEAEPDASGETEYADDCADGEGISSEPV